MLDKMLVVATANAAAKDVGLTLSLLAIRELGTLLRPHSYTRSANVSLMQTLPLLRS